RGRRPGRSCLPCLPLYERSAWLGSPCEYPSHQGLPPRRAGWLCGQCHRGRRGVRHINQKEVHPHEGQEGLAHHRSRPRNGRRHREGRPGAGDAVVATARKAGSVTAALGEHDDLLAVKLDVTDPADAEAAVKATIERFGRLDVLVNNAGNFNAGFFEEISPQDFRAQIETTLFGPVNVTRAALPVMRAQRSGLLITISSTAGIVGQEFCTAYAASKFGV